MMLFIYAHLRRTGESRSRFGRRVANDPRLITDLENGRQPKPALRDRIMAEVGR